MPQPLANFGIPVTGGYSPHLIQTVQSVNSVNATLVVGRPGVLSQFVISNHDTTHSFFKFYNTKVAPVVGTDIPLATILIPPRVAVSFVLQNGLNFSTGIGFGLTKNPAISDTTAVAADSIVGFFTYV